MNRSTLALLRRFSVFGAAVAAAVAGLGAIALPSRVERRRPARTAYVGYENDRRATHRRVARRRAKARAALESTRAQRRRAKEK